MHPLKLLAATNARSWGHLTTGRYNFFICDQVQEAYQDNLMRAHGMMAIPGFAFMAGERWGDAIAKVRVLYPNLPDKSEEFALNAQRIFDQNLYTNENEFEDHRVEAIGNFEVIASQVPVINNACTFFLQNTVINSWMAFEVLADDLWHRVVQIRPKRLNAVSKKDRKQVGFRSRAKMRFSYNKLFAVDGSDIDAAIAPTVIDALAVMRNLLVHSAGKIDNFFEQDSKDIPEIAHLRSLQVGDAVMFDGTFVRSLIDPVTPCGYALIKAVDQWLSKHF